MYTLCDLRTSEAKLNNFCRIEPVLRLLEISFDTNKARDIMNERHGTAASVVYELFVALNKKKKSKLTGTAMEAMRPAAPAKLEAISTALYQQASKSLFYLQSCNHGFCCRVTY